MNAVGHKFKRIFCSVDDKQKYCNQSRKLTAMVAVNIIQPLWILIMFFFVSVLPSVLQHFLEVETK